MNCLARSFLRTYTSIPYKLLFFLYIILSAKPFNCCAMSDAVEAFDRVLQTGEVGVRGAREVHDRLRRVQLPDRLREGVIVHFERSLHRRRVLPESGKMHP